MADEQTPNEAQTANTAQTQETPPQARMLANYVKDLSFENVAMQSGVEVKERPKFELNVGIAPKNLGENTWEVALKIKVKAESEGKTVFLIDLDHAGRFNLSEIPEAQRGAFLLIECPRLLFPFTRRLVSDLTRDGGYVPLNLENIDFVKLYRDNVQRMQNEKATQTN